VNSTQARQFSVGTVWEQGGVNLSVAMKKSSLVARKKSSLVAR
jgi:hypothetical protein